MRQTGIILSTSGNLAEIGILSNPVCKGCNGCLSFSERPALPTIVAENHLQAQIGEQVEFEIAPGRVLGSALMIFMFPLILLALGYWLGRSFATTPGQPSEGYGILGAFCGLAIGFVLLKLFDQRWRRTHPVDAVVLHISPVEAHGVQSSKCLLEKNQKVV